MFGAYTRSRGLYFPKRMKTLSEELKLFHVMVDSSYAISLLDSPPAAGTRWSVYLKVDCGNNRGTVTPSKQGTISEPVGTSHTGS